MSLRSFRQTLKNYFTFSNSHRRYAFLLLMLLCAALALQWYFRNRSPEGSVRGPGEFRDDIRKYELWTSTHDSGGRESGNRYPGAGVAGNAAPFHLSVFDPNATQDSVWTAMGIPLYMARRIGNYLAAGGRFHRKEDLKKIYGFREQDYQRLEPYIVISRPSRQAKRDDIPALVMDTLDLNTASADDLMRIRGIGPARSGAIVSYRKLLGGFCRKEQLLEVYTIDTAAYIAVSPRLQLATAPWRRIDINGDLSETRHPYLTRKMARLITRYREMHGPFQAKDDLHRIQAVDSAAWQRIFPYLVVR